jgi:predicted RNase H-like HicB family nuclease
MRYIGLLDQTIAGIGVAFPDCPGCVAMGSDRDEALSNARQALAEWLNDLPPDRRPSPRSDAELRVAADVLEQLSDGAVFVTVSADI